MTYRPDQLVPDRFRRMPGASVASDNERRFLRALMRHPGLPRSALAGCLDLTQQSVHRISAALVARGMVRIGPPPAPTGRGKPSPVPSLDPDFAHAWGVSLNTDHVALCLMDFAGTPLATDLLALHETGREHITDRIDERMDILRSKVGLPVERCLGIGFGMAGFWISGTRYNPPLPLRDWALMDLGPLLSARFRLPVWIENNAKTSALGEAILGHGRSYPTFAYVSFNYGLGGAIVIDGDLVGGGHGNAGEISAIFTHAERPHRPALQHLVQRLREAGVAICSVADMTERFDPAWPGIDRWIEQVAPNVSRLVSAFWAVLDPQAVVLGGQIPASLATALIERVRLTEIDRYGVRRAQPELLVSTLGHHAASIGAAAYALKRCCF